MMLLSATTGTLAWRTGGAKTPAAAATSVSPRACRALCVVFATGVRHLPAVVSRPGGRNGARYEQPLPGLTLGPVRRRARPRRPPAVGQPVATRARDCRYPHGRATPAVHWRSGA